MTCVRKAWLTLGASTLLLEDPTKGYFCTELNLGWPDVREVINNRPDQDGADDRTTYFGPRAITAAITAIAGAGANIDGAASLFAPFMSPAARPQLHYVLDRPGAAERVLTVRASGYQWPIVGDKQRDVQLAWVAADPLPKDVAVRTSTAYAGASSGPGRIYNLTFNRLYPVGGGSSSVGIIHGNGDVWFGPVYRIYGPITQPDLQILLSGHGVPMRILFDPGFSIAATHYVDLDSTAHTARLDGDPNQSVYGSIEWSASNWSKLTPGVDNLLTIHGTSTSGVSQVLATWQDVYLT
jgi:hypothetical protein